MSQSTATETLFPTDLKHGEWHQFRAAGFSEPACGLIRGRKNPATSGMPLGGIDTGALMLETDGTLGYCSIFNSFVPMRGPMKLPYLGFTVGKQLWILTDLSFSAYESLYFAWEATPSESHYWGHYPVADVEYNTPGSPVTAAMRAWSPFIPGDAETSNTPGAVFEIHLRNTSDTRQSGSVGFSFPGPTQEEAQTAPGCARKETHELTAPGVRHRTWLPVAEQAVAAIQQDVRGEFSGIHVETDGDSGVGYALGVVGEADVRSGAGLADDRTAWNKLHGELPTPNETDLSRSIAVDYDLEPGETKIVRIVLAWYAPHWIGEGDHTYQHMYATRFDSALDVARMLAHDHESLLARVLGWQQALYTDETHPVWMREALANILHLFPVASLWAVAKPPIGDWCRKEDGLFGLMSGIINWPDMEVIPDIFYANPPLVFFFPELALSTLRGYKAYQFPDGAAPWLFGGVSAPAKGGYGPTAGTEMASPSPGFQSTTNGPCYVDMVDRYLMRTGNRELVPEFYESIKKNTIFTMKLRPEDGLDSIISVPSGNHDPYQESWTEGSHLEWFESVLLFGMVTHVAGIHLANLVQTERLAVEMGDDQFAKQCREWLEAGRRSMDKNLWTGTHYMLYNEPATQRSSDLVFGYQLDGQWMAKFHGLEGVFPDDRVKTTLETIERTCGSIARFGAANLANPDGSIAEGVGYGSTAFFIPENDILGATYMYEGQREYGLDLVRRCQVALNVEWGYTWDQPNVIRGDSGERTLGTMLTQNMLLWAVPPAYEGKDVAEFCAPGGLVDRIIQGGSGA